MTKNLPIFAVCSNDKTLYLGKLISESTSTMYKIVYNDTKTSNNNIETALKNHLDYFKFEPEATTQTSARAIFNLSDPMGEPDPDRSNVKLRSQSFTSLMADLRQDINRVSSFSRCLNGTRNCSVKTLVH